MPKYIDAEYAKRALTALPAELDAEAIQRAIEAVDRVPAADVVPVAHGWWELRYDGFYGQRRSYCSVCGLRSGIGGKKQTPPFCPNCGAKMDGEETP